ncbi:hypothetical protein KM043_000353 [Ampulex compressa]|nr:hypothetical protein KM043_000353 [Ampulex compressa]
MQYPNTRQDSIGSVPDKEADRRESNGGTPGIGRKEGKAAFGRDRRDTRRPNCLSDPSSRLSLLFIVPEPVSDRGVNLLPVASISCEIRESWGDKVDAARRGPARFEVRATTRVPGSRREIRAIAIALKVNAVVTASRAIRPSSSSGYAPSLSQPYRPLPPYNVFSSNFPPPFASLVQGTIARQKKRERRVERRSAAIQLEEPLGRPRSVTPISKLRARLAFEPISNRAEPRREASKGDESKCREIGRKNGGIRSSFGETREKRAIGSRTIRRGPIRYARGAWCTESELLLYRRKRGGRNFTSGVTVP